MGAVFFCRANNEGQLIDTAAAFVNGKAITLSEVMGHAFFFLRDPQWVGERSRDAALRGAFDASMEQLIDQRLIIEEYEKSTVKLPDWIVEKRISETIESRFDGDRTRLLRELAHQRMTLAEWREVIQRQIVVTAMRQSRIDAQIQIRPSDILVYYRDHIADYTVEDSTEVSLFHIPPQEDTTPEQFQERIAAAVRRIEHNRAGFGAVAAEFDPNLKGGGYRGWIVPEDSLRDDLIAALGEMSAGEIRAVDAGDDGVFVLYKMGQRSAGTLPFANAQPLIEDLLTSQESQRLYTEWTQQLRANAKIEKHDILP